LQKLSGAVFCTQIRRSAKSKQSGFLYTRNSGKTDNIDLMQWGIGITWEEESETGLNTAAQTGTLSRKAKNCLCMRAGMW